MSIDRYSFQYRPDNRVVLIRMTLQNRKTTQFNVLVLTLDTHMCHIQCDCSQHKICICMCTVCRLRTQCLINWMVSTVQYTSHTDSVHYQSLTSYSSLIFTVLHLHCDHASHNSFSSTGVLSWSGMMRCIMMTQH